MSQSIRINTKLKIYFNNTEVDDVYYNNEHIWRPTPYFISNDGTDDSIVSGDINNPFQNLGMEGQELQIKIQYILERVHIHLMKKK